MIFILLGTLMVMSVVFLIAVACVLFTRSLALRNLFIALLLFSGVTVAVLIHVITSILT